MTSSSSYTLKDGKVNRQEVYTRDCSTGHELVIIQTHIYLERSMVETGNTKTSYAK